MQYYISQIIDGIASGCIYGLIGLSLNFIFRSTRVLNFAQGEMATTTVFVAWLLMKTLSPWAAIAGALVFAFFLGVVMEVVVLRMIGTRSDLSAVIVTIAFYAILNSVNAWLFGYDPMPFPSPIHEGAFTVFGTIIPFRSLWLFGCTLLLSGLLFIFFKMTLLGVCFQAISEDPMATRLKGVRVGLLEAVGWGMSSVIGGIAGLLLAPSEFLHPNMMERNLLFAFAAAKIGGLQTSFGPLAGGIIIGVTENLGTSSGMFGSEMKILPVYLVMVLFLVIRPRGLFGRDEPRRI